MYLAYIAPHFPLQARPEDIEKYRGKYSQGYEYYRNQRFQKQQALGVIASNTVLSEADFPTWNTVENPKEEDLKMAVYAAQIDRMDQNIGRLVDMLRKLNTLENTIILFLSDNGATDVELNDTPEAKLGTRDSWAAYGKSWGNVSNTPYRQYKARTHEGGTITPLIMHWPKGITETNQLIHQPVHINDIMPTCLELAGATYPAQYQGRETLSLDGRSFLPALRGEKLSTQPFYWEHQGNQAVREGDMKLVRRHRQPWELYNLKDDPTELRNLSDTHVNVSQQLQRQYQHWMKKNEVQPWPMIRK